MFKIGDYVVCINNLDVNLRIGKVYTVENVFGATIGLKERYQNFYKYRFKKLEDNAINRLLYPEVNWSDL